MAHWAHGPLRAPCAQVLGTLNVLQLAAQAGARLVFVSTTDTYKDKTQAGRADERSPEAICPCEATACKAEPPQEAGNDWLEASFWVEA